MLITDPNVRLLSHTPESEKLLLDLWCTFTNREYPSNEDEAALLIKNLTKSRGGMSDLLQFPTASFAISSTKTSLDDMLWVLKEAPCYAASKPIPIQIQGNKDLCFVPPNGFGGAVHEENWESFCGITDEAFKGFLSRGCATGFAHSILPGCVLHMCVVQSSFLGWKTYLEGSGDTPASMRHQLVSHLSHICPLVFSSMVPEEDERG